MAFYTDSERQSRGRRSRKPRPTCAFRRRRPATRRARRKRTWPRRAPQVKQGEADAENARLTFEREEAMYRKGVEAAQAYDQARTGFDAARARVEALRKQEQAAEAAVALAKGNADQNAARRAALDANVHQLAAMGAQKEKAKVRLDYTEIRAPIDGIVDVRAALQGEVVSPGKAIVTLIDPDNLWVRADVEESYIDSVRLGDR